MCYKLHLSSFLTVLGSSGQHVSSGSVPRKNKHLLSATPCIKHVTSLQLEYGIMDLPDALQCVYIANSTCKI